ncbi:hypothetical protein LTR17_006076 [Elasticomyces elasticus]|nr:hypothetical protein LTR17_006076 [Elasticomyces elasticus]
MVLPETPAPSDEPQRVHLLSSPKEAFLILVKLCHLLTNDQRAGDDFPNLGHCFFQISSPKEEPDAFHHFQVCWINCPQPYTQVAMVATQYTDSILSIAGAEKQFDVTLVEVRQKFRSQTVTYASHSRLTDKMWRAPAGLSLQSFRSEVDSVLGDLDPDLIWQVEEAEVLVLTVSEAPCGIVEDKIFDRSEGVKDGDNFRAEATNVPSFLVIHLDVEVLAAAWINASSHESIDHSSLFLRYVVSVLEAPTTAY